MHRLSGILVLAMVAGGCASGRSFRHGQEAMRAGDWDAAVAYFRQAVQDNPDSAEYKISLQRAQEEAARVHIEKGRELEKKDQLDGALAEYRRALELDSTNRLNVAKVAELERTIRERLEAAQQRPRLEQMRQQAKAVNAPPLLNPASREPIRLHFNNASLRDILNTIGSLTGVNITYEASFHDVAYSVDLDGVTIEQALNEILSSTGNFYKVVNPRTILVIPDNPTMHQRYDELVIRVIPIGNADATELATIVNTIMRVPGMQNAPTLMPNKTANTITVRGTAPVVDIVERVIKANDKPRAEVLLDIEILEVDRVRVKQYGINLSNYSMNLIFSPEVAPPNLAGGGVGTPPPFNLNTISQGVSTADFYLGVPTAIVNFLESDSRTKLLAKPELRGAEGNKLTLNLGSEIPVITTAFGASGAGGIATIPTSSYSYRPIGVNLEITPRVTYDGDIQLELSIENSALGSNIVVAGQSIPSFTSRKVTTHLRLREGESNLLAGLMQQNATRDIQGVPGAIHVPVLKQLFSGNNNRDEDTDIVMLITPHIVRSQEITADDLGSIYIGTQQNVGLTAPPPLISTQPDLTQTGGTAPAQPTNPTGGTSPYNQPPPGLPTGQVAAPPGVQPVNPPLPPGTSPVPGVVTPQPVPQVPTGEPPANPAAAAAPATPPREAAQPAAPPTPSGAAPGPATPAQIIVTPPGTEFRVAGGPYTMPVSINNASRVSVLSVSITYNPAVLRVRTVQEGTFMRQGGVAAAFAPRVDSTAGRIDIAVSRTGDQTGASGAGLLAAIIFDAVSPGTAQINVNGVANTPEGTPIALNFSPVTVTVR
ncbi:MAG TPA: secretin N-terminal domain-containing protein [Vicinamibacterales bacterium]|nr:secretin N-terminal domain-containing protein [Vicinamibacterales bacterium]